MKGFLAVIGAITILFILAIFAVCNDSDDDSLGRIQLVSHEYGDDRCQGYECREGGSGNEGEYRDDNRRGGISPGPFDRSPVDLRDNRVTICFPFANCRQADEDQPPEGQRPQSVGCLVPFPYHCDPKPNS